MSAIFNEKALEQAENAPRTNNPGRSAEYFGRVNERRKSLRDVLTPLVQTERPLIWEVGCGHGHFLTAYAAVHANKTCIGVDIVRERIARAKRKGARAQLTQLHFLVAEAHDFLDALPSHAKFSAIFVLFPDPWPKRRHHKNRLLQSQFLDQLFERVARDARLYFRTDHEPYFSEVVATVRAHSKWSAMEEPWPFELETVFQARAASYRSLIAAPKFTS